jgi:hypothetical protein
LGEEEIAAPSRSEADEDMSERMKVLTVRIPARCQAALWSLKILKGYPVSQFIVDTIDEKLERMNSQSDDGLGKLNP